MAHGVRRLAWHGADDDGFPAAERKPSGVGEDCDLARTPEQTQQRLERDRAAVVAARQREEEEWRLCGFSEIGRNDPRRTDVAGRPGAAVEAFVV
jgi:hypothetical protein